MIQGSRMLRSWSLGLGLIAGVGAVSAAPPQKVPPAEPDETASDPVTSGGSGTVFTMSNEVDGNEIITFDRSHDGRLTPGDTFPTGGFGTGGGLGNQGGVVLAPERRRLFAVNAGSDEVSVFSIHRVGLVLTDIVPSGGDMPVSVTMRGDLLYVLNAGGAGNITGFGIDPAGKLLPLPGSTRPLSGATTTAAAQIQFSPYGDSLVVTEKATNLIDVYTVNADGLPGAPLAQPSSGPTPFGFDFTHQGRLIVSEAFGGAADASAVSSYDVGADGTLSVVSPSIATTETAACWIEITGNGRFAYTTNTGSGTISGYRIGRHSGELTLLDGDGVTADTGGGSAPIDMALSEGSRFLYVLNSGTHEVMGFRVRHDGGLTPLSGTQSVPEGANGLAAH